MLMLLGEHLDRRPARDPVRAGVDLGHELLARRLQLREVLILVAQVVIGRDQIGLRDLHRRL